MAENITDALAFSLSPGQRCDHKAGIGLLRETTLPKYTRIVMDRGHSSYVMRAYVRAKRCVPVVPPKDNHTKPWRYDKALYRDRNAIERLFRFLKNFRRIATRYDKLALPTVHSSRLD